MTSRDRSLMEVALEELRAGAIVTLRGPLTATAIHWLKMHGATARQLERLVLVASPARAATP